MHTKNVSSASSKIWFQKLLKFITALREHCENAKEREAMLIKLPYGTVICVLSFRFPAKVARLLWKTDEAE